MSSSLGAMLLLWHEALLISFLGVGVRMGPPSWQACMCKVHISRKIVDVWQDSEGHEVVCDLQQGRCGGLPQEQQRQQCRQASGQCSGA